MTATACAFPHSKSSKQKDAREQKRWTKRWTKGIKNIQKQVPISIANPGPGQRNSKGKSYRLPTWRLEHVLAQLPAVEHLCQGQSQPCRRQDAFWTEAPTLSRAGGCLSQVTCCYWGLAWSCSYVFKAIRTCQGTEVVFKGSAPFASNSSTTSCINSCLGEKHIEQVEVKVCQGKV